MPYDCMPACPTTAGELSVIQLLQGGSAPASTGVMPTAAAANPGSVQPQPLLQQPQPMLQPVRYYLLDNVLLSRGVVVQQQHVAPRSGNGSSGVQGAGVLLSWLRRFATGDVGPLL